MAELKPCPFCGCAKVSVGNFAGWFYGKCLDDNCRTMGPTKPTKEEAIEAWNRRAENDRN